MAVSGAINGHVAYPFLNAATAGVSRSWTADGARFRRDVVPALGGVWCLAYLVEIIRCTLAIYGYVGTP